MPNPSEVRDPRVEPAAGDVVPRTVVWWSAGSTSAVAAALALRDGPCVIAYCASVEEDEHPDNGRFLQDCERWYGQTILRLYSDEYKNLDDLWERRKYIAGINGAPCTKFLKRRVRERFQRPGDTHVFGFDDGEHDRAAEFAHENRGLRLRFPLIERGLRHGDCEAILATVGIELPAMYRLGYRNNNCIGCVKGGAGYWNKIRDDFPDIFAKRAEVTRRMGCRLLAISENGVRRRIFLDELPLGVGRYEAEPSIECGAACQSAVTIIHTTPSTP